MAKVVLEAEPEQDTSILSRQGRQPEYVGIHFGVQKLASKSTVTSLQDLKTKGLPALGTFICPEEGRLQYLQAKVEMLTTQGGAS